MKKIASKLERIAKLEQLLLAHPEGLRQSDIARRLGVHRSTVGRYLTDVTGIFPVFDHEGLVMINRDHYPNNVKLTVHEIMVLHLATRLFHSRTDKHNPHASSAMLKMGNCLHSYSDRMSEFILTTARSMEKKNTPADETFVYVLEKITRAWSDGLWLFIRYFSHATAEIHEYHFAPWFVQPYAAGFSVYAVGFCREKQRRITLKVERIREARLLNEKYEIPDSFNPDELFQDAWGIWYADEAPVDIVLKFSAKVAGRVEETVWHASQETEQAASGDIIWRASIAEPLEMVPWIRGWGSDCEVLEPSGLRCFMKEEADKLGRMYG